MAKIHVLALDAARTGGAGVYTARLIHGLHARGHEVTLVCHEAESSIKKIATVHEIPRPFSKVGFGLWRFSAFLQIGHYRAQLKLLGLSEPTIVFGSAQPMTWPYHTMYPDRPFIYLPHSLVAPVELASYDYGTKTQRRIAVAAYEYLEKKCLLKARTTVRFTETACNAFRKYYGPSIAKNLTVFSMPIELPRLIERDFSHCPLRLLSVGRLIKSKNILFLLKLMTAMLDLQWHLDIVGTGDEQETLERFARDNQLWDRVTFHGHREDVESFYRSADLFVFPSLLESLGLVLLEAMSYSVPSLSFNPDGKRYQTATNEFVTHTVNGLLASDEPDFQNLLRDALTAKFDLVGLGRAAFSTMVEDHQWDSHIEKIETLISVNET